MPAPRKQKETRQQGRPTTAVAVGKEAVVAAVRSALKATPPGELTFKQIADVARVDQRLIRYYYGSLPDLLRAVAIEITEELRARFAAEDAHGATGVEPRQRLRARILIFLGFFGDNPHYHRLVVDYLINTKGADRDAAVARFERSITELHGLLEQCSPSGQVSIVDAQLMHVSIAALCEYLFSAEAVFTALFHCRVDNVLFRERFCDFVAGLILGSLEVDAQRPRVQRRATAKHGHGAAPGTPLRTKRPSMRR